MSCELRFVDPHVHLWDLTTGWYPLLDPQTDTTGEDHGVGPFGKLQGKNFLLPDYFGHARGYGVQKMVHVTAAQAPPTWPDETRFLQELFSSEGYPHGIIGWTDFDRPLEEVDAELAAHAESPNFRGIRHQAVVDYTSEHILDCFGLMQRRGLIYDTVAHEDSLAAAALAAKRFPEMSFVLEHTGWPSGGGNGDIALTGSNNRRDFRTGICIVNDSTLITCGGTMADVPFSLCATVSSTVARGSASNTASVVPFGIKMRGYGEGR